MILPRFPAGSALNELVRVLVTEDERNYKRTKDVELANNRLILRSPDGSRFAVTVDNTGVLSTVAL